jgi:hypothetical protein
MNYALLCIISLSILCAGIAGYFIGRYQTILLQKIQTLEGQTREVVEPAVTMGVLTPPKAISTSDAPVGIAEAKTPQRVEYEAEQETERQGLS